ncbi:hypothetical protein GCM10010218_56870 [Streptomyces mashuensis]|uniref:Uncharacterized protein n=1 Tax=Streptomyces mashuensis TaxID=33904 RepID=A0A919B9Q7_9ACTN|nr:hypothetical protein [Streptomyces mashuensis]GHF67969.1 hypothetical protein GCM10010218_56870 [Streptomyces mashuensis]
MSDTTPSQAEGERDDDQGIAVTRGLAERGHKAHAQTPRTTPSQAEGERDPNNRNQNRNRKGQGGGATR